MNETSWTFWTNSINYSFNLRCYQHTQLPCTDQITCWQRNYMRRPHARAYTEIPCALFISLGGTYWKLKGMKIVWFQLSTANITLIHTESTRRNRYTLHLLASKYLDHTLRTFVSGADTGSRSGGAAEIYRNQTLQIWTMGFGGMAAGENDKR